jgi:hypothetical protein
MKRRSSIIRISDWVFNPSKRAHRFRCGTCRCIIQDHSNIVLEKWPRSSTGYHADCFDNSAEGAAANARDAERRDPSRDKWHYPQ